jgi:hypothetical protein
MKDKKMMILAKYIDEKLSERKRIELRSFSYMMWHIDTVYVSPDLETLRTFYGDNLYMLNEETSFNSM